MNSLQTLKLSPPALRPDKLTWFRFGNVGQKVLLTTDTGEWHALTPDAFSDLISGSLTEEDPDYSTLVRKGFIRDGFDLELHAGHLRRTKRTVFAGATQHRIHLSTASQALPMEQAKAIVDHIFAGSAESFTLSLIQGPKDPDPNIITFLHEFAEEKNKYERRDLFFDLHSSLSGLTDAMIAKLIEKRIQIRAFFDGDAAVHDAQRHLRGAPDHATALQRIQALNAAAEEAGLGKDVYSTFGEVQVGKAALSKAKGIVAGLAEAGIREFRVAPILEGDDAITAADYGQFVRNVMACLVEQEGDEEALREVQTDALLTRIRTGDVADSLVMSSAPSNGYNARSYAPDGNIFPSCSALQLNESGDPIFLLGNVATESAEDIANHPTIRSLMVASLTDCLPGYQHLWSTPYIGVDPVAAYRSTGDLFAKMPTSANHKATQALVEAVFLHVIDDDDDGE